MLKPVSIILLAVFASTPALAHAGDHHFADLLSSLEHFLSEPLHGGIIVLVVSALMALRIVGKRRLSKIVHLRQR